MAISEAFQDSATIGTTEYFLASDSTTATYQTADGAIQLWLELNNLANGDEFRIRVYEKISSGGTARVAMEWVIAHAQSEPLWVTPTLILMHGWEFSLTRLAGADRSIAWSIRSAA
jgi:ribonuclease HI